MTARRLMLLALVVIVVAAVLIGKPEVRQRIGKFFRTVKEDVGPGEPSATIGGAAKMYVPRGDRYYHRRDCPRLEGLTPVPMPLPKAKGVAAPCPTCRPPE
ncbi:MAG: hypothetical protein ACYTFZ_03255 [Planctomycetota bacterium]